MARVVEPSTALQFCERHDIGLWRCLCAVVQISPDQPEDVVETASLPMVLGGVWLQVSSQGERTSVLGKLDGHIAGHSKTPPLRLQRGWLPSSRWVLALLSCVPQLMRNEASRESWGLNHPVGRQRHWEHAHCQEILTTSNQVVCVRVGNMKPALGWSNSSDRSCSEGFSAQVQALIRSQGGPEGGAALTAVPTCSEKTIPSHFLFRVVLLRRLRQSLPLSEHSCRCGRLLDAFGHHRAVCA